MDCDVHGVKLWRMSNSFSIEFRCFTCACIQEKVDAIPSEDKKGVMKAPFHANGNTALPRVQSDQIGSLVPAVPSPDGTSCFSYGNVPAEGCQWWWGLPFYPMKRISIYTKPGNRTFLTADNVIYEIHALNTDDPLPAAEHGTTLLTPGRFNIDKDGNVTPVS